MRTAGTSGVNRFPTKNITSYKICRLQSDHSSETTAGGIIIFKSRKNSWVFISVLQTALYVRQLFRGVADVVGIRMNVYILGLELGIEYGLT